MDKLTSNYQVKLQNIINYYSEYRKTHYDDNIGITIENQRREEEQKVINTELQKIKDVKTTEKYVLLNNEKYNICEQIKTYYNRIDEKNNDIIEVKILYEIIETLYNSIEIIEDKQLEIIKKTEGINIELLENHLITIKL